MKRLIGAVAMLVAAGPVFAADVATCTLSADKKTVTVTATNPYSKVMACEVNCDMAIPNGIGTVVCVKPVPVGARDFVMCTEIAAEGHSYTRVKGASLNCPDPSDRRPAARPMPAARPTPTARTMTTATMRRPIPKPTRLCRRC